MESLKIIGLCIAAAILFGVALDQVTARICVEYFTIGHPVIMESESPTLLGLAWGVLATWWVGLLLGVPLALAARRGKRPARTAASLIRPIGKLLGVMAVASLVAGLIGYALADGGQVYLVEPMASRVSVDRHVVFLADLWAHSASYLAGFVGGAIVIVGTWRSRGRLPAKGPNGGG